MTKHEKFSVKLFPILLGSFLLLFLSVLRIIGINVLEGWVWSLPVNSTRTLILWFLKVVDLSNYLYVFFIAVITGFLAKNRGWLHGVLLLPALILALLLFFLIEDGILKPRFGITISDVAENSVLESQPIHGGFSLMVMLASLALGGWLGEVLSRGNKKDFIQTVKQRWFGIAGVGVIIGLWLSRFIFYQIPLPPASQPKTTTLTVKEEWLPPYTKLAVVDGSIRFPKGGNNLLADRQERVLIRNVPKSVSKAIVGPDGKTIHWQEESSQPEVNYFTSSQCVTMLPRPEFSLDYTKLYGDKTCRASGLLRDSSFISIKLQRGHFTKTVEYRGNTGHIQEWEFVGELPMTIDSSSARTAIEGLQVSPSATDSALSYYYPTKYSLIPHDEGKSFLFFGDHLFFVDPKAKRTDLALVIPNEFPLKTVQLLDYHPTLPLALLATAWESPTLARYILDYSSEKIQTTPIAEKLAFSVLGEKSRWRTASIWAQNDMTWTDTGFEFTLYEEKKLPYDQQKVDNVSKQLSNLPQSDRQSSYEKLWRELQQQEKKRLESVYDVGGVICSLNYEGYGSGFGCLGLVKKTVYRFTLGNSIFEKVAEQRWSGALRT